MAKITVTRREIINMLGLKLPVVLLAVERMPGVARAGQEFTQKIFQADAQKLDIALELLDSEEKIIFAPQFDASGRRIGCVIERLDARPADLTHFKPGSIIYHIDKMPFTLEPPSDLSWWREYIKKKIVARQSITVDLDLDGLPNLYVFQL